MSNIGRPPFSWGKHELAYLVKEIIAELKRAPFVNGKRKLHTIVADILNKPESRFYVTHIEIRNYNSLRNTGLIPALAKEWARLMNKLDERVGASLTIHLSPGLVCANAQTMPLPDLLELTKERVAAEVGQRLNHNPDSSAMRDLVSAVVPNIQSAAKTVVKKVICFIVSPGRFGNNIKQLTNRVSDVCELVLLTDHRKEITIPERATHLVYLTKDEPVIRRLALQTVKRLRSRCSQLRIIEAPNWADTQKNVIDVAAAYRRELRLV